LPAVVRGDPFLPWLPTNLLSIARKVAAFETDYAKMVIVSLTGLLSRVRGETIVVRLGGDCHFVVSIVQYVGPVYAGIGMWRHRV
jgi:hypothetical protein